MTTLDEDDLVAIQLITNQAFMTLPLGLLTKFRDGAMATYQAYNVDGPDYLMFRIQRTGSTLVIEWLLNNGQIAHVTKLIGV